MFINVHRAEKIKASIAAILCLSNGYMVPVSKQLFGFEDQAQPDPMKRKLRENGQNKAARPK